MTPSEQTVSPERRIGRRADQKRRWDRENGGTCACGARRKWNARQCKSCRNRDKREGRERRRRAIAEMWERGASCRQIAAAMDSTPGSINVEVQRMRADGWDLAFRRCRS